MGNNNSSNTDNFINLEEKIKEKSIYSFNIILQGRKNKDEIKPDNKYKFNKKEDDIICKLKLYPSNFILKNDNIILNLSYYDIPSWAFKKNYFYFESFKEIFCCKTQESKIIASSLTKICTDIHKYEQRGKIE